MDTATQLHREGIRLSEIAVLYRSNTQSRVIEHALVSAGLAYRVYGGLRFFERQEIKHALAYLRLIQNPADDHALLRIINFPARGIGARTIEQLQEKARAQNISLWQAAMQSGGKVSSFVSLVEMMRDSIRELTLPEIIEHILLHSGLIAHFKPGRYPTARSTGTHGKSQ